MVIVSRRRESTEHNIKSLEGEELSLKVFDQLKWKSMRIMKEGAGKELNLTGIKEFLRGFDEKRLVLNLLEKLNKEGFLLPDFIVIKEDEIIFIEHKDTEKLKRSKSPQKQATQELVKNGFPCALMNTPKMFVEKVNKKSDDRELIEVPTNNSNKAYYFELLYFP